jgi:hypothetical protein
MESAFVSASESPSAVGAQPDDTETEYGWVELGEPLRQRAELFGVRAFREKPSLELPWRARCRRSSLSPRRTGWRNGGGRTGPRKWRERVHC